MKDFLFFLNKFVKPYKFYFLSICILSFISMLFSFISPLLTKTLIDNVFINKNLTSFSGIILCIIFLYIISAISSYFLNFIEGKLEFILFENTAKEALESIELAKIAHTQKMKVGDLINRFMGNIQQVINFIVQIIPGIIISIISIVVPIIMMLSFNVMLTIIVISPIFLFLFSSLFFGQKLENIQTDVLKKNANIYALLNEFISLLPLIKVFNLQKWSQKKFDDNIHDYYKYFLKYTKVSGLNISTSSLIFGVPMVLLLSFGGKMVIDNYLSIGTFTAFSGYVAMFFSPVSQLSHFWGSYKSSLPAVERIKEVLYLEQEEQGKKNLMISNGQIRFENIWFFYDNKYILKEFNCTFEKGLNYIIGENGTGKTTILKLICSLYQPNKGSIKIDGQEISTIKIGDLRENISIIFSEPYLFDGTIYENIQIGNISASKNKIKNAAKLADVDKFIESLPKKYETQVGEKGLLLSSGEKQKIALARTILKDSSIILLDEMTASVDEKSRKFINNIIKSLKDEKTIIIITHNSHEIEKNSNIIYLNHMSYQ